MPQTVKEIDLRDNNFREMVKTCANDSATVAEFNKAHGLNLKCPIAELINPVFPLTLSDKARDEIAWFVAWVKCNHWARRQAPVMDIRIQQLYLNITLRNSNVKRSARGFLS
jgi:hypothetical protein